jgi:hypothetical protein
MMTVLEVQNEERERGDEGERGVAVRVYPDLVGEETGGVREGCRRERRGAVRDGAGVA